MEATVEAINKWRDEQVKSELIPRLFKWSGGNERTPRSSKIKRLSSFDFRASNLERITRRSNREI